MSLASKIGRISRNAERETCVSSILVQVTFVIGFRFGPRKMGMATRGSLRRLTTALVAIAMLAGSASAAAPRSIDPLVALSVLGSNESYAAICAVGAAQAASAVTSVASSTQGAASGGCVLPVVDAAPPPVVAEGPPPPVVAAAPITTAGSVLPLLVGLAAVVAAAALIAKSDSNGRLILPFPPDGVPISP